MASRDDDNTELVRAIARVPLPVRIRVVGAKATPSSFLLTGGSCVIGAASDGAITIDDTTVSRRHVELTLAAEGVEVVNLESSNGTFYLGQRLKRMLLAPGSRFRIGSAELLLEPAPESLAGIPGSRSSEYLGLLGAAPAMRQLFATLARLEGSLVNVLVEGESGAGKELIARAVHTGSALARRPFVTLNCGTLARELVASELFGHRKGAFTGAVDHRKGAFERADGGTLFLDEIGEIPLDVQPMLLRALESGEVQAVGDDSVRNVKARVVAATNRDLGQEVRAGRFREDLYYRLAVVRIAVPPLRQRLEDVPLLASRFAAAEGVPSLPADVLAELARRPWPGNVRELRNAVQAYIALGDVPPMAPIHRDDDLDRAIRQAVDLERPFADQKEEFAARFTSAYLELLMRRANGNQSEAARIGKIDRGYLGKLLAKRPGSERS